MALRFKEKWFNPLYFILNEIIKDHSIRTVLIYGGKSSAKTYSVAQLLSKEAAVNKRSSIAFRKESTTIPTTIKGSFNSAVDKLYLYSLCEKQDRRYLYHNKSEIVLKGIDDEEKAKGVEGFDYLLLDELNQFLEGEYDQFEMSLRGIPGQKIFATWNPINVHSWVKVNLVDKQEWAETQWKLPCEHSFVRKSKCGLFILIKTTYEDNYWINGSPDATYGYRDENLIAKYKAMKGKNNNRYKVEVLGEWGKVTFGGEILKKWRSEDHTGHYPYNPNQAIYLSFDENVNPYFPCGFFQVGEDGFSPRLIHAIAAKNPDNTTKWMGREITRKLREWGHEEHLYIGGDATSKKEDVKQEKGHDLFKLMMIELEEWKPQRKVSTSNPSVRMSTDFFNSILDGEVDGMSFGADESCRVAILDYENTKEDKNGHVDKKLEKDPITKVSSQPWGHFFDLTRYFLVNTYIKEYIKYQTGTKPHLFSGGRNKSKNTW